MKTIYTDPATGTRWDCLCIPQEGSKGRLVVDMLHLIPAYGGRFVDLFAGSGTVVLNAMATKQYTEYHINDLYMAKLFRAILEVKGQCGVVARTRENYEIFREIARRHPDWPLVVIWERCLTMQARKWGRGYGERGVKPENYARTIARAYALMEKYQPAITQMDWRDFPLGDLTHKDTVIVDPPYQGTDTALYDSAGFDHLSLVKALARAKFRWLLCGYDNALYRKAFGSPCFINKRAWTLSGVKAGHGSRARVECMWINYDPLSVSEKPKRTWKT